MVVAVGESPYAEGMGDDPHPALTGAQDALVDALVATGKPVVVVVVAGRPLEMDAQLDGANASLMAFWPGSEGGAAVADVLFGAYNPSGRLTVSWPHDGAAYPIAYNEPGSSGRRYDFGYGLSYSTYMTTRLEAPSWVKARHGTVSIKATVAQHRIEGRITDGAGVRGPDQRLRVGAAPARGVRAHVAAGARERQGEDPARDEPVGTGRLPARRGRRHAGDPRALNAQVRRARPPRSADRGSGPLRSSVAGLRARLVGVRGAHLAVLPAAHHAAEATQDPRHELAQVSSSSAGVAPAPSGA